jgi:hypothetical protein
LKDARIVSQDAAGTVVDRNGRAKLRVSTLGGRNAGANHPRRHPMLSAFSEKPSARTGGM